MVKEQAFSGNTPNSGYNNKLAFSPTGTLYGSDGIVLYTIDLNTGDKATIGSLSPYEAQSVAIAIDQSGQAIGYSRGLNYSNAPGFLFGINLANGSTTAIGPTSFGSAYPDSMSYGSDGNLYGWSYSSVYRINAATQTQTLVQTFPIGLAGFAIIPDSYVLPPVIIPVDLVVPLPAAAWMGLVGLGGLAARGLKRGRSRN